MGSNPVAIEYSGISIERNTTKINAISGLLAAVADVIMTCRFNSVNVSYGQSYLLITIPAAVLGGVDLFGGRGRVAKVVLALIVLQTVSSSMSLIAVASISLC